MGLFGSKRPDERAEKGMRQAEDIAAGRGLTGKLMKGFLGADKAAQLGEAMDSARQAQAVAAMQAQGVPGVGAVVVSVTDTGQLMNHDPLVNLTAALDSGGQVHLQALVSKVQIPRPGDRILLMKHPQMPGQYIYGGLAPQQ